MNPTNRHPNAAARLGRGIGAAATLAALLILLAACGQQTPTPAPTPTATKTPTAAFTSTATATTTATAHPTAIPLPSATAPATVAPAEPTATPEPTPTPSATPFPPGPASKLGLFVGYNYGQLFDLLSTGNVAIVKTLEYDPNFVAEIKQVSPNTLIVSRYTPLQLPDFDTWDPIAAARQFVDLLLPIATEPSRLANIDCWEAYNEPIITTAEQMASLAVFEAERTRLLAEAGVHSCIGNFGTGQPPMELWPAFFPALEAIQQHGGFLGLHEYSAPEMWFAAGANQLEPGSDEGDEGWLTLRYRKVYRDILEPAGLAVPLVITETGVDGLVAGRPGPAGGGWQDFRDYWRSQGLVTTLPEGFYVEQLAWYDSNLAQDDYVRGAAIYTLAGPTGWQSYEIHGLVADILKQYLAVHPPR